MDDLYCVMISNADNVSEAFEVGNDLLRFNGLPWDESLQLVKYALGQGYFAVLSKNRLEAP